MEVSFCLSHSGCSFLAVLPFSGCQILSVGNPILPVLFCLFFSAREREAKSAKFKAKKERESASAKSIPQERESASAKPKKSACPALLKIQKNVLKIRKNVLKIRNCIKIRKNVFTTIRKNVLKYGKMY
jgi:hypothetical protein